MYAIGFAVYHAIRWELHSVLRMSTKVVYKCVRHDGFAHTYDWLPYHCQNVNNSQWIITTL